MSDVQPELFIQRQMLENSGDIIQTLQDLNENGETTTFSQAVNNHCDECRNLLARAFELQAAGVIWNREFQEKMDQKYARCIWYEDLFLGEQEVPVEPEQNGNQHELMNQGRSSPADLSGCSS